MIEINFNGNWLFEYRNNGLGKSSYSKVIELPHDFSFENDRTLESKMLSSGGSFCGGVGIYKKKFKLRQDMENKEVYIAIDRAYSDCEVYINGNFVKRHHYGYTRFIVNITKYIKYSEENTVKLIVLNTALPNADFYTGSGILGGIKLYVGEKLHIGLGEVLVSTTYLDRNKAILNISVNVVNDYTDRKAYGMVISEIEGRDGKKVSTGRNLTLDPLEVYKFESQITIENPSLWNINVPQLYTLTNKVVINGRVIDKAETKFGIRMAELNDADGFSLNLRPMKLKGCCIHHDNGVIGAITLRRAEERKIENLKAIGYNAVRTVCAPASEEFLDACDRLGMMVVYELFDGWQIRKMPYGYFNYFNEEYKQTIKEAVNMAKSHPSVIMWSLGNELIESKGGSCGIELLEEIKQYIYSLDPTRPITADTIPDDTGECRQFNGNLNVIGYSYKHDKYEKLHEQNKRLICGMASYPQDMAKIWAEIGVTPYIIGDFAYTGIDYLGSSGLGRTIYLDEENEIKNQKYAGFPAHISNCGDLDICGFLKPQGAYRKVMWGMEDNPYIFVCPPEKYKLCNTLTKWGWEDVIDSWSFKGYEGKTTAIYIYANADEAELIINGKSIDRKRVGEKRAFEVIFEAVYESGTIEVIAYKNGVKMGKSFIETAKEPEKIKLSSDKRIIRTNVDEIAYIKCEIIDERGIKVTYAENKLEFEISEQGRLLGAANGDYMYKNNYLNKSISSYKGQAIIAVKAVKKGELWIEVKSKGLESEKICVELS